jgi:hypothetical protein
VGFFSIGRRAPSSRRSASTSDRARGRAQRPCFLILRRRALCPPPRRTGHPA